MSVSNLFVLFFALLCLVEPSMAKVRGAGAAKRTLRHRRTQEESMSASYSGSGSGSMDGSMDGSGDFGVCFSGRATVQVEGIYEPVSMKELQVGDRVLSSVGTFEPVYAFGHKNPNRETEFIQFYTSTKAPLEITADHLVFLQDKANPVRAASVKVGDLLQSTASTPLEVKKIHKVTRQGVYAPLTQGGKVVVDGIQASSYVVMQENANEYVELQGGQKIISYQDYVHMGLAPFRLVCEGIAPNLCLYNNEDGMPHYVAFALWLNRWASEQNSIFHALVLLVVFALTAICLMLENLFGARYAPSIVAFTAIAGIWMKKKKNDKAKMV